MIVHKISKKENNLIFEVILLQMRFVNISFSWDIVGENYNWMDEMRQASAHPVEINDVGPVMLGCPRLAVIILATKFRTIV